MLDSDLSPCMDVNFRLLVIQLENISRQPCTNVSAAIIQPGNCCYTFFAVTIRERDIIVCRRHKCARLIYDVL